MQYDTTRVTRQAVAAVVENIGALDTEVIDVCIERHDLPQGYGTVEKLYTFVSTGIAGRLHGNVPVRQAFQPDPDDEYDEKQYS